MAHKSSFTESHNEILDDFKERENLSAEEVRKIHTKTMREKYTESEWNESDRILLNDIKIINREIRKYNLKIIRGLDEDDGRNYYMMVNRCDNSESYWETLNASKKSFNDYEKKNCWRLRPG